MPTDRHDVSRPVLAVRGLTVLQGETIALEDVSFELSRGDSVAVVGPNGAGKSTLFKAIAGLLPHRAGEITVYGVRPDAHICIAYVPQTTNVDWSFPVRVFDVVMMGRTGRIGLLRKATRADRSLVYQCLEMVNMEDLATRQIGELSGGQRQRVFIARALAQEAEIVLMDEPLTGLDVRSQQGIFTILSGLTERGVTILVSTHDLESAAERFRLVMLLNRRIVAFGTREVALNPEVLFSTFGGHVHTRDGRLAVIDTCCEGTERKEMSG
jgi:manganese/iron transport system ATP-binding protein